MQYTERYEVRRTRKGVQEVTHTIEGPEHEATQAWESAQKSMGPGEVVELYRVAEIRIAGASRG